MDKPKFEIGDNLSEVLMTIIVVVAAIILFYMLLKTN